MPLPTELYIYIYIYTLANLKIHYFPWPHPEKIRSLNSSFSIFLLCRIIQQILNSIEKEKKVNLFHLLEVSGCNWGNQHFLGPYVTWLEAESIMTEWNGRAKSSTPIRLWYITWERNGMGITVDLWSLYSFHKHCPSEKRNFYHFSVLRLSTISPKKCLI